MKPLVPKAAVATPVPARLSRRLSPGAPATLSAEAEDAIAVHTRVRSRLPLGLGSDRLVRVGLLDREAADLLSPALQRHATLRVRIVEIEPPHLSPDRTATVYVSVWGNPEDLRPVRKRVAIFSESRINGGPAGAPAG